MARFRLNPRDFAMGAAVLVGYQLLRGTKKPIDKAIKRAAGIPVTTREYTAYLREESVRRGLLEGRQAWLALGAVLWSGRALRLARRRREQVLLREVLGAGEQVVIRQIAVPSRRQRRRARRAEARG